MTYRPYYPPQRPTYPPGYRPLDPPPPRRRSSQGAWILVAVLAVVGVIGLIVFAGIVIHRQQSDALADQAHGQTSSAPMVTCPGLDARQVGLPPDPRSDPDCYFVYMMTRHAGLPPSHGVPGSAIADAHAVCRAMDQALATGQDTAVVGVQWVQRKHPDLSISDAAFVAGISEVAYCPWDNTHPMPLTNPPLPNF